MSLALSFDRAQDRKPRLECAIFILRGMSADARRFMRGIGTGFDTRLRFKNLDHSPLMLLLRAEQLSCHRINPPQPSR